MVVLFSLINSNASSSALESGAGSFTPPECSICSFLSSVIFAFMLRWSWPLPEGLSSFKSHATTSGANPSGRYHLSDLIVSLPQTGHSERSLFASNLFSTNPQFIVVHRLYHLRFLFSSEKPSAKTCAALFTLFGGLKNDNPWTCTSLHRL